MNFSLSIFCCLSIIFICKPNKYTADKNVDGSTLSFNVKNFIVDETVGERYHISNIDQDFLTGGHHYVVYPGEYNFGYDLVVNKDDITISSKTDREDTLINLSDSNSKIIVDANDITIKGLTIDTNEEELGEAIYVADNNKNNSYSGIRVGSGSKVQIKNNLIEKNAYTLDDSVERAEIYVRGLSIFKSEAVIKNNFIRQNEHEGILLEETPAEVAYNKVENNYFGTTNLLESTETDYLIVNKDGKEVLYGNIDYKPYANTPIEEAGIE